MIEKLKKIWGAQGIALIPPLDRDVVIEKLRKTGHRFSSDVVDLYCETGGMVDRDMDDRCFSLWPLDVVVSENASNKGDGIEFGDFLIDSHRYSFRWESPEHSSVWAEYGSFGAESVAHNVSEFFQLMLFSPSRLMLMGEEIRPPDNNTRLARKYDDASWHYAGDFPADLPAEAGAIHIGMFVAWCLLHGMSGELHTNEFPEELTALRNRKTTPGRFVIEACDGKFSDEDLDYQGNAFATAYFGSGDGEVSQYVIDYEEALEGGELTLYHVQDNWKNYDKLAPVIEQRFIEWKQGKFAVRNDKDFDLTAIVDKSPWWKFWG